jgi:hypothetical protein
MRQVEWKPQDAMPSDIAAIGEEFSRAIHADHRRRKARRSCVRRAIVVIAVVGVGSGTALAAQVAVEPGYVLNPCIARAIETPGLYPSLWALDKGCHLPDTPPPSSQPVPPPHLPQWIGSSAGAHRTRTADAIRRHRSVHVTRHHMVGGN